MASVATMAMNGSEDTRAALGNLVKEGKITPEEAVAYAQKMGLMTTGMERSVSLSKTNQLFNFSVYKWSRGRTVQRLILQFDFQSQVLSSIQHGTRTKKVEFTDITGYTSEDGPRLSIQFASQSEYELDADNQDEKNKVIRLLAAIIEGTHNVQEEPPLPDKGLPEESTVKPTVVTDDGEVQSPVSPAPVEPPQEEKALPLQPSVVPPSVLTLPIKEGMVEKRGHSAAFLMWPKRWLKVCAGELLYCKPDDLENALNIVPLNPEVTSVKKVDSNGFSVSLQGSRKVFSFRTLGTSQKTPQEERDEWYQAILDGYFSRRGSTSALRRGTITAKEMMEERNKQIPKLTPKLRIRTLKHHPQSLQEHKPLRETSSSEDISQKAESSATRKKRSQTFSAHVKSPTLRSETMLIGRKSTFFDSVDITTPYTESVEFPPLQLQSKTMDEMLTMLKKEVNTLCNIVIRSSTGKSQVDMMVARLGSIVSALLVKQENGKSTEEQPRDISALGDKRENTGQQPDSMSSLEEKPECGEDSKGDITSSLEDKPECGEDSKGDITSSLGDKPEHGKHTGEQQPVAPEEFLGSLSPQPESELSSTAHSPSPMCSDPRSDGGLLSPTSESSSMGEQEGEERRTSSRVMADSGGLLDDSPKLLAIHRMLSEGALRDSAILSSSNPSAVKSESSHVSTPTVDTKTPLAPYPPPLPPALGGVVPPPPPLLFPGSIPPPPLPPGAPPLPSAALLPPKTGPKPQKKMKKFYWATLPPAMVVKGGWIDWGKKDLSECLDLEELEKLFHAEDDKKAGARTTRARTEVKTLLDTTRSRNIEIFLPSFPVSLSSLDKELNELLNCIKENSPLKIEHIVALKRFQPTQEEKEMYRNYKEDKSLLQNADTFLLKLSEIPLLSVRLDLLFTIREFPANFEGFEPILELAWQACRELDTCEAFVEVLQYVLAVGNYLNAGSRHGGAYGFKLAVLPKLSETHGHERKTTLLHYLIQQMHRHQPQLLELPKHMEAISNASNVSITSILAELEVMQKELDKIEKNATMVVEKNMPKDAADALLKDVKEFVAQYREQFHTLVTKGQEMDETYGKLLVRFGELPSTDSEDFFSAIAKFVGQFKKVTLEMFPPPKPPKPSSKSIKKSVEFKLTPATDVQHTESVDSPVKVPPKSGDKEMSISTAHIQANKLPALGQVRPSISTLTRNLQPKEGILEKRTKDGKRWEKRYFELERSQLHYYLGKGQKYRDTIRLYGIPVKLSAEDPRVLLIETEARIWHLKAETNEVAKDWLTALKLHTQAQGPAR